MEKEEGEMSDDNYMSVDSEDEQILPKPNEIEMDIADTTIKKGLDEKTEITDVKKLEERAKRFGLNLFSTRALTQKQIDDLYSRFIKDVDQRHFRFDTLHLRGVEDLTTKEIFEYLEDYKPVSLEWVDRASCNVVCHDNITAALAMLAHSREIKDENLKEMLQDSDKHWREGFPHPAKDLILFRFATNSDKKDSRIKSEKNLIKRPHKKNKTQAMDTKNPWGDLCISWGVYDHQEVLNRKLPHDADTEEETAVEEVVKVRSKRLAKRLGKRRPIEESDESGTDTEWKSKSKVPRMRMHADDLISQKNNIEIKNEKADAHSDATLSIEFENHETSYTPRHLSKLSDKFKAREMTSKDIKERRNIRTRLGLKIDEEEDRLTDDSDADISIRFHKLQSTAETHSSTVWSRLDSKIGESSHLGDLRERLKAKKDDLRKRIPNPDNNKGRIRIEIHNNGYDYSD